LRAAVGDPLFIRAGNRLVATPRAVAMRDRVAQVAAEIATLLRPAQPLDIAALERLFVIRASDATIVVLGRALERLVRREAPRVTLHFVGSPLPHAVEVDLDIGVQYRPAPDLRTQRLYQDVMIPVVRRDHACASRRVTARDLAALEYVAVAPQAAKLEQLRRAQLRRGRAPGRVVPSFLAAAALVRHSDAYTILPERLAAAILDAFALCRLSVAAPPAKITITQAWSPRLDNDAGHIWLRGCVRRACGDADHAPDAPDAIGAAARVDRAARVLPRH
jgi:DNA-binding transcriptional LysR family regulator